LQLKNSPNSATNIPIIIEPVLWRHKVILKINI
jgi:hypothetical protein